MQDVHLSWATEPLHTKMFFMYLVVVLCVTIVYVFGLARRLFRFRHRWQISLQDLREGKVDGGLLAQAAFANAVSCDTSGTETNGAGVPPLYGGADPLSQTLRMAHSRFLYLWNRSQAHVSLIEKLFRLTLLLSLLDVVHGIFPAWQRHFNNAKVTGLGALAAALDELLVEFALGLTVSVALFIAASFFEHALRYRMLGWEYFYSSWRSEFSDRGEAGK
jgi:hypothetical protein